MAIDLAQHTHTLITSRPSRFSIGGNKNCFGSTDFATNGIFHISVELINHSASAYFTIIALHFPFPITENMHKITTEARRIEN